MVISLAGLELQISFLLSPFRTFVFSWIALSLFFMWADAVDRICEFLLWLFASQEYGRFFPHVSLLLLCRLVKSHLVQAKSIRRGTYAYSCPHPPSMWTQMPHQYLLLFILQYLQVVFPLRFLSLLSAVCVCVHVNISPSWCLAANRPIFIFEGYFRWIWNSWLKKFSFSTKYFIVFWPAYFLRNLLYLLPLFLYVFSSGYF